jgi:hypothetical protein
LVFMNLTKQMVQNPPVDSKKRNWYPRSCVHSKFVSLISYGRKESDHLFYTMAIKFLAYGAPH